MIPTKAIPGFDDNGKNAPGFDDLGEGLSWF